MRRLIEAYQSWLYRRWLRTPAGQRFTATMAYLVEHQSYLTLHSISDDVAAKWTAEP